LNQDSFKKTQNISLKFKQMSGDAEYVKKTQGFQQTTDRN